MDAVLVHYACSSWSELQEMKTPTHIEDLTKLWVALSMLSRLVKHNSSMEEWRYWPNTCSNIVTMPIFHCTKTKKKTFNLETVTGGERRLGKNYASQPAGDTSWTFWPTLHSFALQNWLNYQKTCEKSVKFTVVTVRSRSRRCRMAALSAYWCKDFCESSANTNSHHYLSFYVIASWIKFQKHIEKKNSPTEQ